MPANRSSKNCCRPARRCGVSARAIPCANSTTVTTEIAISGSCFCWLIASSIWYAVCPTRSAAITTEESRVNPTPAVPAVRDGLQLRLRRRAQSRHPSWRLSSWASAPTLPRSYGAAEPPGAARRPLDGHVPRQPQGLAAPSPARRAKFLRHLRFAHVDLRHIFDHTSSLSPASSPGSSASAAARKPDGCRTTDYVPSVTGLSPTGLSPAILSTPHLSRYALVTLATTLTPARYIPSVPVFPVPMWAGVGPLSSAADAARQQGLTAH